MKRSFDRQKFHRFEEDFDEPDFNVEISRDELQGAIDFEDFLENTEAYEHDEFVPELVENYNFLDHDYNPHKVRDFPKNFFEEDIEFLPLEEFFTPPKTQKPHQNFFDHVSHFRPTSSDGSNFGRRPSKKFRPVKHFDHHRPHKFGKYKTNSDWLIFDFNELQLISLNDRRTLLAKLKI